MIYHDLNKMGFPPEVTRQCNPDPGQNQAHLDSLSGNMVMKYPVGLAVQSLPFFAAGPQGVLIDEMRVEAFA